VPWRCAVSRGREKQTRRVRCRRETSRCMRRVSAVIVSLPLW
jgi:hypothetical protein